jgi:hypothetical protein
VNSAFFDFFQKKIKLIWIWFDQKMDFPK